jgi:TrmH family RNA methyltransferase
MLSKNRLRFIVSLQKKKIRDEQNLFVIEGDKLVKEFLNSDMKVISLLAKPEFLASLSEDIQGRIKEVEPVSCEELKQISSLKTPHNAIALIERPVIKTNPMLILNELCVALDFIQDPGNLGTIIRAASWFGIKNVVCSEDCVDVYNPKVIQATMGAILNVKVHYHDLKKLLSAALDQGTPVYGTTLKGESIYDQKLSENGVILLGNESKGISEDLIPFVTIRLMIPKLTSAKHGIDSLNVGMAASVIFSEFARRRK